VFLKIGLCRVIRIGDGVSGGGYGKHTIFVETSIGNPDVKVRMEP
jgi:hypothetical protein|tara:strand:- start:12527 stop:12661 length:135 start_codon:yes stop_codon:yes gene_type:complete